MNGAVKTLAGVGFLAVAAAGPANAVVCTGTTMALGNGGVATGSFLLGAGNCVSVSDKIFGEFSVSGAISGQGSAQWSFVNSPGNVTLGFLGAVLPSAVGGITYSVAVDLLLADGFQITSLEKDFTLNASVVGLGATASLSGGVTSPFALAYNCNRTVNPSGGTCPETHSFAPVNEITVSQTITTGANALVTAITDTIGQTQQVAEPGALGMLGTALGLLWFGNHIYRRREENAAIG